MNTDQKTSKETVQDPIIVSHKKILQRSSFLALFLTATCLGILAPTLWQASQLIPLYIGGVLIAILGFITLARNLPTRLHSLVFLTVVFLFSMLGLFIVNPSNTTKIGLLLLVAMSAIMRGRKTTYFILVISTLLVTSIEIIHAVEILGSIPNLFLIGNLGWVIEVITFALTSIIITSAISTFGESYNNQFLQQKMMMESLDEKLRVSERQIQAQAQGTIKVVSHLATYQTVSSLLSKPGDMEGKCKSILETIIANYHLYYGGIYLFDEKNDLLNFLTGTGEIGTVFKASNHKEKTGDRSIFLEAISSKENIVIADIKSDPAFLPHPLLGATRSQLVIPILTGEKVYGILDIHDDSIREFSLDEIQSIKWIASLLGIFFENDYLATAFKHNQDELNKVYQDMTRQNWQSFFRRKRKRYSFRFSHSVLERDITTPETVNQVFSEGSASGIPMQLNSSSGHSSATIAIPIKLRNEVLGALNIKVESSKALHSIMPMLEAATDRIAVALENARLLEEIQDRATREHLISEISAKVRSSTNVEQVLRTTATEISRSLGVSEVVVQLRPPK